MTYQVLARKWRPKTFGAVVGQEALTRTLQNAIGGCLIDLAYLFDVPRGVGKTTTARLLAKTINCLDRQGAEPCTVCSLCQEIQNGNSVDVIEIDGASNRGIDEIRTLRENVKYAPARGRYKVYIIDEVHMLTEPAFNALLKTLEEPPSHVVFILATTEPRRIPLTILSRCQRFDFKPVPPGLLSETLGRILGDEGGATNAAALDVIARAADGSLRDALSLLDTALAHGGGALDAGQVQELLGRSSPAQRRQFREGLLQRESPAALEIIGEVHRQGQDLSSFCREVLESFRHLLILKLSPTAGLPEISATEVLELRESSGAASVEELLFILRALLAAEGEMRRSPHPRVELEMAVVRIGLRPSPKTLEEILERVEDAEARLRQMALFGGGPGKAEPVQESLLPREPLPQRAPERPHAKTVPEPAALVPPSPPASAPGLDEGWRRVVEEITQRKPTLGHVLAQALPLRMDGERLVVALTGNHFQKEMISDRANQQLINQTVRRHIPGAERVEVENGREKMETAAEHPAVQALIETLQGEVVAVRPRGSEGGEGT
jgi:DNA polymerase-3 subunit gamma/tau